MAMVKTFEGLAGSVTVRGVRGGIIDFEDGSFYLVLSVDGKEEYKLMFDDKYHADGEAQKFSQHFKEGFNQEDGEGMSEFEKRIARAAVELSFTEEEKQCYKLPKDKQHGDFSDLF